MLMPQHPEKKIKFIRPMRKGKEGIDNVVKDIRS